MDEVVLLVDSLFVLANPTITLIYSIVEFIYSST
jgi:hypothetical protein